MGIVLGLDCKLYLCTGGIGATPGAAEGVEVVNARSVKVPLSKTEADVSTRGGGGWKAAVGATKEASIDFDLLFVEGDPNYDTLLDSYNNGTLVGVRAAKGDPAVAGTECFEADCEVMKMDGPEELDGAIIVAVSLKPTFSADPPRTFTVAA
jgi:predicted secreted protein